MQVKMKKSKLILVVLVLLAFSVLASATEIIVLNDTEERLYSLDDVLLSGDLATNELSIRGRGEVILGKNVKVYLFGPSSDLLVEDIVVNDAPASISFDDQGYFFVAEKGVFKFNGKLKIRTIGQIRLFVPGPMNQLRFNIQHGYAIDGDRFGLYKNDVIIQRAEKVSMLVDGSFRYTYAERNEFLYQINFKAFGSTLGSYTLPLENNEVITSVSGAMKWEQKEDKLILDLEGADASVVIRGLFDSQSMRIPLEEDRHHVLIESDPEKKISITTTAQEIDLSESPLQPQYSNARAFLASKNDVFSVAVKKLDVLPSLAASVRSASNIVAITESGSVLGELTYSYANTGVDYLEVDVGGTPLYASTENSAVKLTKDEKLLLSFPKTTYGTLDLVYFTTRDGIKPVDLITIPTAKTDLPITTASTSIYLPKDYIVLETFGAPGGSELPPFKSAAFFAIIVGLLAFALKKDSRFAACYMLFAVGLVYFDVSLFLFLMAVTIILIIRKHLPQTPTLKWIIAGAGLLFAVGLIIAVGLGIIWQLGTFNMGGSSDVTMYADKAVLETASAPMFKGFERIGEGSGAITVPTRQGVLPVKLELPALGKTISVTNHLVTKENPVELKILVVAAWFKYLLYAVALIAGASAYKRYRK